MDINFCDMKKMCSVYPTIQSTNLSGRQKNQKNNIKLKLIQTAISLNLRFTLVETSTFSSLPFLNISYFN